MNVLFLLSDEHAGAALSCAGHGIVRTPQLDRLSAGGTRFTAAYSPSPICVPARAALATGRHVHETRYWDNAIAYDGRVQGWGHQLQAAGRRIESIGKLHYRAQEDKTGFDRQIDPMHVVGGHGQVWGLVRNAPNRIASMSHGMLGKLGPGASKYNDYDRHNTDQAIAWLEEAAQNRSGEPWCLFVGLVAPHFPLTVAPEFFALYDPERMPAPRLHPDTGYHLHPWLEAARAAQPVDQGLSPNERRLALASYFALCSFVDHQIGRILDALDASGLADDTLVIYSSDHGDNMGARGMWGKGLMYDESVRVPLILSGPGIPQGHICRTPTSLLDARPTILAALDVDDDADNLPGASWLDLSTRHDDLERLVLSQYHAVGSPSAAFMLCDANWKYVHYVGYQPELFDLERDPGEIENRAERSDMRALRSKFESKLNDILDPNAIDAAAKADQAALIEYYGGIEKALKIGAPGATPVPVRP